jgi:hypothetical protein
MAQEVDTWICPDCGAEVKVGARRCPGCGPARRRRPRRHRRRRSWQQDPTHDGLGLPDDDFDYDEFVAREFGEGRGKPPIRRLWWLTALLLVAGIVALLVSGLW